MLVGVDGFGIREVLRHSAVDDDAVVTEEFAAPGHGLAQTAGGEFLGKRGVFVALSALIELVGDPGDDTDGGRDNGAN